MGNKLVTTKSVPTISQRLKTKSQYLMASAMMAPTMIMTKLYAAPNIEAVTVAEDVDADQFVGKLGGIILLIARYGGIVMLLWGAIMFGFAVKNDEPESKQKALMTIIAGIILLSLKTILQSAGIVTGGAGE